MSGNEKNLGSHLNTREIPGVETERRRVEPPVSANSNFGRLRREHVYGPVVLGICHDAIVEIYMSPVRRTIQATLYGNAPCSR